MVKEGIVLGHMISASGMEVDQAKVSIIKNLMPDLYPNSTILSPV